MNATGSAAANLPRSWSEFIPPLARWRIAIVTALVLFAYWGPIRHHLIPRWIHDGNWSHGWLVPVFSLYFLACRSDQLFRARPRPSYLGAAVLLLSLTAYFLGAWWLSMTYPQVLSLVGSIFGLTLLLGGWGVIRVAWFPILFLVLAIPLPQGMYVSLTLPLRELASWAAAGVMPLMVPGLWTEAQAVVIDWVMPGGRSGQLNVEQACSGMRLLMAFVALGVAMAYLGDRPRWHRIVMVLSCIPIAVLCNAIRVTSTGLMYVHGHEELASGTPHQLLGILMLAIALGLYALIGYVLSHLFIEEPEDAGPGSDRPDAGQNAERDRMCEVAP